MASNKRDDGNDAFTGSRGDDFVKYGLGGRFPMVMTTINDAFHPKNVVETKKKWEDHLASIGGIGAYKFGMFSEFLLKDLLDSGKDFPTKKEWGDDSYRAPIVSTALTDIIKVLQDNLAKNPPVPMHFVVKKSATGEHYVEEVPGSIVTMYCPADDQ